MLQRITKKQIKDIFLKSGVGEKYSDEAVQVWDFIAEQTTGKKLGQGVELYALKLKGDVDIKKDVKLYSLYPVVPYTDELIVQFVQDTYIQSQLWFASEKCNSCQ